MRSEGFPKRFSLRRWTEGPLEGMMDLSADAEGYRARAQRILGIGIAAALAFLLLLAATLIADVLSLVFPFFNPASIISPDMPVFLAGMALAGIFLALAFLVALLLTQTMRYAAVMFRRFENVEDLFGLPERASAGRAGQRSQHRPYMGLFNILGASSSFTKDIVRNMPQVCRQIKFVRTMLFLMPLYYVGLRLCLPLIFGGPILPQHPDMPDALYEALLISLSALSLTAGLLVCETGRFMEAVHARLKLLDCVRGAPQPLVPKLDTPAARLAKYLEDKVEGCKIAHGSGGFIIRHASEDCILLAVETASVPDVELVRKFTESCVKELDSLPRRTPRGRFIILYAPKGEAEDIGEDVEAHILANPIALGRGPGGGSSETVVQIMVEEGGAYGMFPFVE